MKNKIALLACVFLSINLAANESSSVNVAQPVGKIQSFKNSVTDLKNAAAKNITELYEAARALTAQDVKQTISNHKFVAAVAGLTLFSGVVMYTVKKCKFIRKKLGLDKPVVKAIRY